MESGQMMSLQDVYLMALAQCCESVKLQSVMQQTGDGAGRVWLMREGTTIPHAWIGFKFGVDDVALKVMTRTEHEYEEIVKYAAGLDRFLPELLRTLNAGLLAAPKSRKAA